MRRILPSVAASALCLAALISPGHTAVLIDEWYTYRHDNQRTGAQNDNDLLSNPANVRTLHCIWSFPPDGQCGSLPAENAAAPFKASPIVFDGLVLIGDTKGVFYAVDETAGALRWVYPGPRPPLPPLPDLTGACTAGGNGSFGNYGIFSSGSYANVSGLDNIIFGAPDPALTTDGGLGSARLYAFDLAAPGKLFQISNVIAHVTGCTPGNTNELHQRIAYSSPLVLGDKVYVGIHDAGDDPIQDGKVVAVDLKSGQIDSKFSFVSTGTRGGGVWNSPATSVAVGGIYFTTGNTRCDSVSCQPTEPTPNHGLSMMRVDTDTGSVTWKFQPVPFGLDDDPDWAAGVTVMSTSCGELAASVQKDGWSYAVDATTGVCRWQFPPLTPSDSTIPRCTSTGFSKFDLSGPRIHGDTGYRQPGAASGDVFVVRTGGESLVHDGVTRAYGRLHALNACAMTEKERVRWIADIPNSSRGPNALGPPTVASFAGGRFVAFILTDQGHLVALGDPSIVPTAGITCSNPDYPTVIPPFPSRCIGNGFSVVPVPAVLADVPLHDGPYFVLMRNEPVLADGAVFVSTPGGPSISWRHKER